MKTILEFINPDKPINEFINPDKPINEFINTGKLPVRKIKDTPQTTRELKEIISQRLKVYGSKANLNDICTSYITNMDYLFKDIDFNGDISKWDVDQVTSMDSMFSNSSFDGDLSLWDTSGLESANYMFAQSKYTGKNGDIGVWDTKNLANIYAMFAQSKFEGDVNKWDTTKINDVKHAFDDIPGDPPDWYYDILYK